MKKFSETFPHVLDEISSALSNVEDNTVEALVDAILESEKVFLVGVGRVMLSLQAIAKRLNHLGFSAHCVGDINEPAISEKDLLIVGSASGESLIPVAIAQKAKRLGATLAHIGSNPDSVLAPITDVFVRIPVNTKLAREDEIESEQVMTSLFEQSLFILGDTVAWILAEKYCLDKDKAWRYHANLE